MIFIYPCVTSENVNRQIVPAATKCMEQFFLLQLQNAFNDGIIGCTSGWDSSKHRYGPVVTESTKFGDPETLVEESAFNALDNVTMTLTESKVIYHNTYVKPRISVNDNVNEIIKESLAIENKLHGFRIQLTNLSESASKELQESAKTALDKIYKHIKLEHTFRTLLEAEHEGHDSTTGTEGEHDKYHEGYGKKRGELDAEHDYNKTKAKDDTKKNFGKAEDYKIDLTPTSVAIDVDVTFQQGPKHHQSAKRTIMIGVKVVPIQIKNFKKVNDALLDDYFSRVSENFWNSIKRGVARKLVGGIKHVFNALGIARFMPSDPVDDHFEKNGDVVKQMITLAPSDFVNASAFRSDLRSAPMNYKFTSSVVMFNKDDIEEDTSIFKNRSAMTRLFKLGWTSFAVLDPVKEVMLFISSLDGGFLHELPYSYLFNSLQANDIYKNESGLRNGTRPFNIRKGNFATFARFL